MRAAVLLAALALVACQPTPPLDPADPLTPGIVQRDATTFTCERYVHEVTPFVQAQRMHVLEPHTYEPVEPRIWRGITQLRRTIGETCADPAGVVTVDMTTIPPEAGAFITEYILRASR